MFVTARQLEDLHRTNGHVTLPRAARLTPLAVDWLRAKRVVVQYELEVSDAAAVAPATQGPSSQCPCGGASEAPSTGGCGCDHGGAHAAASRALLWWCDGPCGPTKAALVDQAKASDLRPSTVPNDAGKLVAAIKHLAAEVKAGRAAGGVLVVKTGAAAVVYANRCPSLRAILGTCRDAVDQGVAQVAANVLVIEHPYVTLHQARNLLAAFARGRKPLPEDVRRQLRELATCG
jgi:ribose 5-phosphate isomerase RpiB